MIEINFLNIENLLFENDVIRNNLSNYKNIFDDWLLCKMTGNLNKIKQIKINLLNSLTKEDIEYIESILKDSVLVKQLLINLTKNLCLSKFESCFSEDMPYKDYCITSDTDNLCITFWK